MLYLKKVCCLLLCLACVTLAACTPAVNIGANNANSRPDGTVTENDIYKIYIEDGQWYMDVKEEMEPEKGGFFDGPPPVVVFTSLAEMKSDLLTGQFTDEEWEEIKELGSGELVNLDTLLTSVYPNTLDSYTIEWDRRGYAFRLVDADSETECQLFEVTTDTATDKTVTYHNWLEHLVSVYSYLERETVRVETEAERNATSYYWTVWDGEEVKDCVYTIEQNDRTFYVHERYSLSGSAIPSADVPQSITMYCISDNQCYKLVVRRLAERPSVEWLTAFDLVPYVEE